MNIYDYRTIPPEESAYHARTVHGSDAEDDYGDGDIPREDMMNHSGDAENPSDPDSSDFGVFHMPQNVIPDGAETHDEPGGY